jgi:hypothetical protein
MGTILVESKKTTHKARMRATEEGGWRASRGSAHPQTLSAHGRVFLCIVTDIRGTVKQKQDRGDRLPAAHVGWHSGLISLIIQFEVLSTTSLSAAEARSWQRDLKAARKQLKPRREKR